MPMTVKLPRTIRLDSSDSFAFERAAEPGEWAVSGAFAFLNDAPEAVTGRRRQAFANGFLGVGTFGWSTLVTVATATEADVEGVVAALARHFVELYGAPDLLSARHAAVEEVRFAAGLCDKPINTLLAVERRFDDAGGIRESFRVIEPKREKDHARIWELVPDTGDDAAAGEGVDLIKLAGQGR